MFVRKLMYAFMNTDQLLDRAIKHKQLIIEETDTRKIKKLVEAECDLLDVMERKYGNNRVFEKYVEHAITKRKP